MSSAKQYFFSALVGPHDDLTANQDTKWAVSGHNYKYIPRKENERKSDNSPSPPIPRYDPTTFELRTLIKTSRKIVATHNPLSPTWKKGQLRIIKSKKESDPGETT